MSGYGDQDGYGGGGERGYGREQEGYGRQEERGGYGGTYFSTSFERIYLSSRITLEVHSQERYTSALPVGGRW